MKTMMRKGVIMGDNFIWLIIALLGVFYILQFLPYDVHGAIASSPIAFLQPSFNFVESLSNYDLKLPVGAIALVIVFLMFMKKN